MLIIIMMIIIIIIKMMLAPCQLGFGVAGGVEAAVHASRIYLNHLPPPSHGKGRC